MFARSSTLPLLTALLTALLPGCLGEPLTPAQIGAVTQQDTAGGTDTTSGTDAVSVQCTKDDQCQDPGICQRASCNPQGQCAALNDDAEKCDDGNACTTTDKCASGKCEGSGAPDCDDKNACTVDSCDPTKGCQHKNEDNGKACDDGDLCATEDNCQDGKCTAGKATDCDDSNPCTTDSCEAASGCKHTSVQDGTSCGDGQGCVPEECTGGVCKAKGACPCQKDSDCIAKLDNGNLCDGSWKCDTTPGNHQCLPVAAVTCEDDNPGDCTVTECEKTTGSCKNSTAKLGTTCDLDGLPCTQDVCTAQGKCELNVDTCGCKSAADCPNDGNPCNGIEFCDLQVTFTCQANLKNVPKCDKVTDCAYEQCNSTTGKCEMIPVQQVNKPCNDGNSCTEGDYCELGECKTSANVCGCTTDADCASKEDGDLCNGTMFCNKVEGECQVNPKTIVSCPSGDNSDCLLNICDPKVGTCSLYPRERLEPKASCTETDKSKCPLVPKPESEASAQILCDDGNPCTATSQCAGGKCEVGENSFLCSCTKDSDCAKAENGNLCDGVLYCDVAAGKCVVNPASIVSCNPDLDTDCRKNVCDPLSGQCAIVAEPDNKACDDGNPCSLSAICTAGVCKQDSKSNGCSCINDADCVGQEDGNLCNGTLYCNKSSGKCEVNPATVKACTSIDDTYCQKNLCDPKTGVCSMTNVNTFLVCDDGNPCTALGTCQTGSCSAGANLCECQADADCAGKEDGNLCNGTLYCNVTSGKCEVNPATLVYCSPANDSQCALNTCDPKTGSCALQNKPVFAPCDDGNVCTAGDTCDAAGACTSGSFLCECTADVDCSQFSLNLCAPEYFCDKTVVGSQFQCKVNPATVISCDQSSSSGCAVNQCDPTTGSCAILPDAQKCNDGNPCTADSCNGTSGSCEKTPVLDGTPCGAGSCQAGVCKVGP